MSDLIANKPGRGFWIIASIALLWNLIGVMTYLMSVTLTAEDLAKMSAAERALYVDIPAWVTAAYAIAVFGGTLGCVALLLRKAWAVPLFAVSLVAILVQMGHAFFMSDMLAVQGATAAALPITIIVVAIYLLWFANAAKKQGLIG